MERKRFPKLGVQRLMGIFEADIGENETTISGQELFLTHVGGK